MTVYNCGTQYSNKNSSYNLPSEMLTRGAIAE